MPRPPSRRSLPSDWDPLSPPLRPSRSPDGPPGPGQSPWGWIVLAIAAFLSVVLSRGGFELRPPAPEASPIVVEQAIVAPEPTAESSPQAVPESGGSQAEVVFETESLEGAIAPIETLPAELPVWRLASFPVDNFVAYTSPFGYRQHPYGGWRFHYGLDIAAPMGSYIRAWWGGTVVEVSDDTACGTSVVVQSQDWMHIYCHLQGHVVVERDGDRWMVDSGGNLQVRQGDAVTAGQRIGRIGMTGRTTGPHLHWGLKYRGSWLDPALVLRAMIDAQNQSSASE